MFRPQQSTYWGAGSEIDRRIVGRFRKNESLVGPVSRDEALRYSPDPLRNSILVEKDPVEKDPVEDVRWLQDPSFRT